MISIAARGAHLNRNVRESYRMLTFELIAERKIAEAAAKGDFDDLPGAGKPLDLEEDPLVAEDQRMANRILRNSGFGPLREDDNI